MHTSSRLVVRCAAFAALAALTALTACTVAMQPATPSSMRDGPLGSVIAPGASHGALLYVSDGGGSKRVYVYSFPAGKQVGRLSGFSRPQGECTDTAGDVWITDEAGSTVYEYAHGGTTPLSVRPDGNNYPIACSVDPTTGDLAVVNGFSASGGGSVGIYTPSSGLPSIYTDPQIAQYSFVAYDASGNLYVDGSQRDGSFALGKMAKGSGTFTTITLHRKIKYPGPLEWDGSRIAVGDSDPFSTGLRIYRVLDGRIVGKTILDERCGSVGVVSIADTRLVGLARGCSSAPIFAYPGGGPPYKRLKLEHVNAPSGVAVSK